ncbi:unnamed protein product [Mycena citricolor]|uniref:Uncharacterized protein n=1 Tax=Mycena citricolor TaxID=2018698 RepID=A0AAD2H2B9_9AGAR|nr:unnamed protein product [Mycena citricolor]CAK5283114.1 unnamed protein product [Mycena citricolor]
MDAAPASHIVLGISIGLLASCIQSLGLTIQRKSHVMNEALDPAHQRVEHRRPLWLVGFAIFISSNIVGSLVQIASLPVVILAPLGAVSLLWNAFFARLLLGDVFSLWMILGTLFIAGGAILIAVFGIVPEPTRSLEDLLRLFNRPAFVVYFSLLGAAVLVTLVVTHLSEFHLARRLANQNVLPLSPEGSTSDLPLQIPENPSTLTTGVADTIGEAITTERTPLLDRKSRSRSSSANPRHAENPALHRTRVILAISYASVSGILSGMCLLFAKSGVELLLLTLGGDNQFWRWQAWMLVLGLVGFALLQLWYLHKALILADPTLVCPSAFCFYNLSSIVNGLVYFDQFSLIPPAHLALVILGIVILLGGVWVVSVQSGSTGGDSDTCSDSSSLDTRTSAEAQSPDPFLSQSVPSARDLESRPWSPLSTASQPLPSLASVPNMSASGSRRRSHLRSQTITSPPPPNPVTSLSGGLQIGLSPVSPGFSIRPRRMPSGFGRGQEDEGDGVRTRDHRRRTVSEGDAARTRDGIERPLLDSEAGIDPPPTVDQRSKGKWKWRIWR